MKFINKHKSLNYDKRCKRLSIKYIIIHYTAMRTDVEAINYLCNKNNQVSSHFLINRIGKIFNLVNVNYRAWHAGKSYWKKERDINSNSIGIEIDNSGYNLDFENYNSILKNENNYKGKICGDDYELTYDEVKETFDFDDKKLNFILTNNKKKDYLIFKNNLDKEQGFHPGITLFFHEIDYKIKKYPSGFWCKFD